MVSRFRTPAVSDEAHDSLHQWDWHGGIRGIPGASLSSSRRAVFLDAYDHQIEEAKRGNLINVKVERLQENPETGDFQWGILTQPAYCRHCSVESGNSWRAPMRTTIDMSGHNGKQRPMMRQEQEIHAQLQSNPELIPSEETVRAERRSRLGKYDRD